MFKKVLTTTVLGVSVLSAMAANATTPSLYVTGQIGYANNNMKLKSKQKQNKNYDLTFSIETFLKILKKNKNQFIK